MSLSSRFPFSCTSATTPKMHGAIRCPSALFDSPDVDIVALVGAFHVVVARTTSSSGAGRSNRPSFDLSVFDAGNVEREAHGLVAPLRLLHEAAAVLSGQCLLRARGCSKGAEHHPICYCKLLGSLAEKGPRAQSSLSPSSSPIAVRFIRRGALSARRASRCGVRRFRHFALSPRNHGLASGIEPRGDFPGRSFRSEHALPLNVFCIRILRQGRPPATRPSTGTPSSPCNSLRWQWLGAPTDADVEGGDFPPPTRACTAGPSLVRTEPADPALR